MCSSDLVRSRLVPHIGNTLGFRVTWNGRSVVYLSDHQMPADGSLSMSRGVRELCQGADLLIHDSQYTPEEFERKADWGHCTAEYAVWVATAHGVKNLALFHHDPSRSDDALDARLSCLRSVGASAGCHVFAAHEGQTVLV